MAAAAFRVPVRIRVCVSPIYCPHAIFLMHLVKPLHKRKRRVKSWSWGHRVVMLQDWGRGMAYDFVGNSQEHTYSVTAHQHTPHPALLCTHTHTHTHKYTETHTHTHTHHRAGPAVRRGATSHRHRVIYQQRL